MFKKSFKVATHNVLSGKDRKKMRQVLSAKFDPASVDILLGKSDIEIFCDKLAGSKTYIYTWNDIPILVDENGKGNYFPTVYAIQMCPNLVQCLTLKEGVEHFIFNGANLMWPGVKGSSSLPPFNIDDVRSIVTSDNEVVAVGTMACSKKDLENKGPVGTATIVLHVLGDKLWESGPQKMLEPIVATPKADENENPESGTTQTESTNPTGEEETKIANEGDAGEKISKEDEKKKEEGGNDDDADKEEPQPLIMIGKNVGNLGEEDNKKKKKGGKKGKGRDKKGENGDENDEEESPGKQDKKASTQDGEKKEGNDDENEEEKKSEDPNKISPQQMDEYLMEAFLTALRISVKDKDLPIEAGEFLNNHVLACKREGVFIEMKGTTYKKVGKFLKDMDKLGIIEFQEAGKKNPTPQVTKINRQHPKLIEFRPVVTKVVRKEKEEVKEVHEDDKWPKIIIEELYKPKIALLPLLVENFLENAQAEKDKIYSQSDIHHLVNKYLGKNKLLGKGEVIITEDLKPLFWRQNDVAKSDGSRTLPKDVFMKRVEDYCAVSHRITNLLTGRSEMKPGTFKGLTIIGEKTHNKNVTRISGLEPFLFNIPRLVNKWQLLFACSVSTQEVTIHGNFVQEAKDYLEGECKIDPKYISVSNKLEKKKKK